MDIKEILIIITASVLLGFVIAYPDYSLILPSLISIFIILAVTIAAKKITAYNLEAKATIKFWSVYRYGFQRNMHFKKPLPMFWLSALLALISRGIITWLPILEFDIEANPERVSRRHGFYRYTRLTDWHVARIATAGIIAALILSIIGYVAGFDNFARLSIFFALWSLLPISSLDGTKIFFGSRALWFTMLVITAIFFSFAMFTI